MRRLAFAAVASLLALGAAPAARAAIETDVVLVEGASWQRLAPLYAALARAPGKGSGAAARLPPILLVTEGEERWTRELLARLGAKRQLFIGDPARPDPELQLLATARRIEGTDAQLPGLLAAAAFPPGARARTVYLVDGTDAGAGLAASALAARDRAPLLVAAGDLAGTAVQAGILAARLAAAELVFVGTGDEESLASSAGRPVRLLDVDEALAAYGAKLPAPHHLVIAAPSDTGGLFAPPRLSLLAIPFALGRGAALAFTAAGAGADGPEQAALRLEQAGGGPFSAVTLVGDSLALPMREIEDLDAAPDGAGPPRRHRIPPFLSPAGSAADRSVGRLAALDAYDLSRWVARLLHGIQERGDSALLLANADEKFILGEVVSRATAAELTNAGVDVAAFYREEIDPALIRKELPGHPLVVWEGHPRDLTLDDDALPAPEAALPPATYFLQGCYTLDRSDPYVLIERGADAVLGTYMAVYSASGSGFAKAYLDAQLYKGATAGEALTSARNFLLASVELKKRRGHDDWRKTLRAALSFDLWGDPTAPPVLGPRGKPAKPPVTAKLAGRTLTVTVPREKLPTLKSGGYTASVRPNAQLSALYRVRRTSRRERSDRALIELFFVEVKLPPELGDAPVVEGPYPPEDFAWVFAPRSRILSLLIVDRALPDPDQGGRLVFNLR